MSSPADRITLNSSRANIHLIRPSDPAQHHPVIHTRGKEFAVAFRRVEVRCLAFSYNKQWLKDSDSPSSVGLGERDTILCVESLRIFIVRPNKTPLSFKVATSDTGMRFSALFACYANGINKRPENFYFTLLNKRLRDTDFIVEKLCSFTGSITIHAHLVEQRSAPTKNEQLPSPSMTPASLSLATPTGDATPLPPAAFLTHLVSQLSTADANFLSEVITSWLDPSSQFVPDRDDASLLHDFAHRLISWRDDLVKADTALSLQSPNSAPESTFLNRQKSHVMDVEHFWAAWHSKLCHDWEGHRLQVENLESEQAAPEIQSSLSFRRRHQTGGPALAVRPPPSIRQAMRQHAVRRLLRDARMVYILALVLQGWKAQLNLAPSRTINGSYLTDLRIMQVCRTRVRLPLENEGRVFSDLLTGQIQTYLVDVKEEDVKKEGLGHSSSRRSTRLKIKPLRSYHFGVSRPKLDHGEPHDERFWAQTIVSTHARQLPTPTPSISSSPAPSLSSTSRPSTRRVTIQERWTNTAREAGAAPVELINEVDDEEVPPGVGVVFTYTEQSYIPEIGISLPTRLVGCQCTRTCTHPNHPTCHKSSEGLAYNAQGLFMFNTHNEVVECNKNCACPSDCINRVAQRPRQIPIQIVLGLYTGKRQDADRLTGTRGCYCFDLDANEDLTNDTDDAESDNLYSVDASPAGNWTRFLNHSCDPNMTAITVVFDSMPSDNIPYIAFVACKDIPAYTELTFDYNPHHQSKFEAMSAKERAEHLRGKPHDLKSGDTRCLCGSKNCRGWYA
ncbi:hypothetical protein C8F01DRAFT_1136325 [Mycena amicta]|nr:hypothetical protein C8F01DRAFT_1136325 [Mycena amicta]